MNHQFQRALQYPGKLNSLLKIAPQNTICDLLVHRLTCTRAHTSWGHGAMLSIGNVWVNIFPPATVHILWTLLLRLRDPSNLKNLIWMAQTLSSLLSALAWMDLGQTWCSQNIIIFRWQKQPMSEKHSAAVMAAYPQPLGSWSWSGLARQKDIPEIVARV